MPAPSLGALQRWIEDPDVEEVMVVGGSAVWTDGPDGMRLVGRLSTEETAHCVELASRASGRRVDLLSPILDARLHDGSRVCVVLPPVSIDGPTISVRRFGGRIPPLASFGSRAAVAEVERLVRDRANVVVSGATSAGKTTLLSAVATHFGPDERIVCVEDTSEVRFVHPHVVRLQTRPATAEGHGEVDLRRLVRASLRLRPDRLVVGEVRGGEAIDMLLALSSGHAGCWSTVHAASAEGAIERLEALVTRDAPQWSARAVARTISSALDAVVHLSRDRRGRRRIEEISRIVDDRDGTRLDVLLRASDA